VDDNFQDHKNYHVYYEDNRPYTAVLNQTNIMSNCNKFFMIQLLEANAKQNPVPYCMFCHWGRVGEIGQNKVLIFSTLDMAKSAFKESFKQKTGNDWGGEFTPKKLKYNLIEIDYS